jgi:hypothetical protein
MQYDAVLKRAVAVLESSADATLTATPIMGVYPEDRSLLSRPYVKLRLSTVRDRAGNGASPRAGYSYDGNGDPDGWELHIYHDATLVCSVAATTADERDALLNAIFSELVPFENRPEVFDPDTYDWYVGEPQHGGRDVLEDLAPADGFGGSVTASFGYLTRGYDSAEPLTSIDTNVDTY